MDIRPRKLCQLRVEPDPPQPPQSAASSSSAVAVGVQGRGVAQPRVVHPPPLEIPATEDRVPPQSGQQLQGGEPNLQDVLQETLMKFQKMLSDFGNGRNTRANPFEIPNPPPPDRTPPQRYRTSSQRQAKRSLKRICQLNGHRNRKKWGKCERKNYDGQ